MIPRRACHLNSCMLIQVLGPGHDLEEFYTNTRVVEVGTTLLHPSCTYPLTCMLGIRGASFTIPYTCHFSR